MPMMQLASLIKSSSVISFPTTAFTALSVRDRAARELAERSPSAACPGRWPFCGAVCGARHPGLLALRSASGLGPPAVCGRGLPRQRSTGLVRRSGRPGDELPRVICEVVLGGGCGLARPLIRGRRSRAPVRGCGPRSAGQAASAWQRAAVLAAGGASGDVRIPAVAVHGHGVDPAQQGSGARDPGPGAPGAGRALGGAGLALIPGRPVPAARACAAHASAAAVSARYLAAMTGL